MKQKLKYYFSRPSWAVGFITFIILAFYARVLGFGYVWDDMHIITSQLDLSGKSFSFSELSRPFLYSFVYFRPFTILTFYVDVFIAGYDPGFSHGVNLFLHILNSILVFFICRCILDKTGRSASIYPPFFAALLYAIHPAMTEVAAWISGRFDLLATFFILSATWVYIRSSQKWLKMILVPLLAFLALLCKETGIMFPFAILCVCVALHVSANMKGREVYLHVLRENRALIFVFIMLWCFYVTLRLKIYGYEYVQELGVFNLTYFFDKGFLALEALKFYLTQIFFPFGRISAEHPVEYTISPWSVTDILGNIATLTIMASIIIFAVRRVSCSAWIFLSGLMYLLLVLHIVPIFIGENLGHERFLATPLAFWSIAIALTRYDKIPSMPRLGKIFLPYAAQRLVWLLALCWILLLSAETLRIIPFWKNNFTLFQWTYSLYPENKYARYQYFSAAIRDGRADIVEEGVKKIQKKTGRLGLDVDIQALYGSLLVQKREATGQKYLEAIIGSILEFHLHEQGDALEQRKKADHFITELVAYTYLSYSEAVFLFEKNPEKALEYSEIARWYAIAALEDFVSDINYRQVAYLYALEKYEEGDALRIKTEATTGSDVSWEIIHPILALYCQDPDRKPCQELVEKNILPGNP
jgi:hypothetical protein